MTPVFPSAAVILGCKELRCAWDPDAPIYVVTDKIGRRAWERRMQCVRCGSVRIERFKPDGSLERIGSPRYERPDAWKEEPVYYSAARLERLKRHFIEVR